MPRAQLLRGRAAELSLGLVRFCSFKYKNVSSELFWPVSSLGTSARCTARPGGGFPALSAETTEFAVSHVWRDPAWPSFPLRVALLINSPRHVSTSTFLLHASQLETGKCQLANAFF